MDTKNTEKSKKKKIEFSKLVAASASLQWWAIIVASFVLMFITHDLSPLMYIVPAAAAQGILVPKYYEWKARTENIIKLKAIYGKDIEIPAYTESNGY